MTRSVRRGAAVAAIAVCATGATMLTGAVSASASPASDAAALAAAVSGANAQRHLVALQRIADTNGGNRAAGTSGHEQSAQYVAGQLRQSGFTVTTQAFTFETQTVERDSLTVGDTAVTAIPMTYTANTPDGGVTGPLRVVPEDADTGCTAADFVSQSYTGAIALIRRGGCTFGAKAQNAAAAGAVGVVISNNTAGDLNGTLGAPDQPLPVVGISQADGTTLAGRVGASTTLDVFIDRQVKTTRNVIAQTKTGRTDNVVMLGAHLDSVEEGPGINDNGSGSAGLLEIARKLGSSPNVTNAVRFAWWSAEELGLLGSENYVSRLNFRQKLDIALYMNFDMIASPNAAYFVYDGDDSDGEGAGPGPYGSGKIENRLAGYLNQRGFPTEGTDFDGRSDYGPFIAVGIPSSGIFTGAEDIKTADQAAKWGGRAGIAYDKCYHQACDNLGNINPAALDRNVKAAAYATGWYAASTAEVNGVSGSAAKPAAKRAPVAVAAADTAHGAAAV